MRARPGPAAFAVLAALAATGLLSCATADRGRTGGPGRPVNVLLVTADSLRAEAVDWRPGGATPALAALASGGTRFDRAYTVTPWTAPSLVSIFTGLYPPTHGVANRDDTTPRGLPTLPRILGARGLNLANFGFFTAVSYYRNLGLPPQAVVGAEINGSDALAAWLGTAPEPFFAWIHDVEPHMPYGASGYEAAEARVKGSSGLERAQVSATLPVGPMYSFDPGDAPVLRRLYLEDVSRMDSAIGHVLDALERRGIAGRTLVVFTADHGEELLDHGWVGHASTSGEAKLTEEVLRIPLVVRGPGVPAGKVTDALAQNVDVTPTILDLLGAPRPREMQGVSLVPAMTRDRRVRQRVFFDTSPGGHLTPDGRKGERLQGVGDGTVIHAGRLGGARQPGDPDAPTLAGDLARFRKEQARDRLRFLTSYGQVGRPEAAAVVSWEATLPVREPADGGRLGFVPAGGTIRLAWDGGAREAEPYWVEYAIGSGLLAVSGAFPVEEPGVSFGPFPVAFWNDLAGYSPFRFRVLDPSSRRRSAWRAFSLDRADVAPGGAP